MIDPPATEYREEDERYAEHGGLEHPPGPPRAHVEADEDRDWDRGKDGRCRPGAVLHRVDDDEAEHRDEDDHDHQGANQRGETAERSQLLTSHLPEAASVPAGGEHQDRHILHATAEDRADDDPQSSGEITELCRQSRTYQRSGARNGR